MSDRREFLKGAGILGLASLSKGLPAQTRSTDVGTSTVSSNPSPQIEADAVVLENAEMRLVIGSKGAARSLLHKATGQECLATNTGVAMFNVTQYRPLDNELQLASPAKITHFPADQVRREGDRLIVRFALVGYEAAIGLKITDSYIAFQLESLTYKGYTPIRPKHAFPLDETVFLQLPIRARKNLGDWLNVIWDEEVAVNVLATDTRTQIDAKPCAGYYLFQAGSVRDIQLENVGAALIATATPHLLDRIAQVEEDFNLPRGVESRRSKDIRHSYYQAVALTPQDVDRHIKFAKMAGFRQMMLITSCFAKGWGHLPWLSEYPRGMADLKEVTGKIRTAGITPGLHVLHTMVTTDDPYVTPKPDPRLSLLESYTLAADIDPATTEIEVEESPKLCPADGPLRVLRIGNELLRYEQYTATAPYRFEGCQRGVFGTQASPHQVSSRVGLLNMYSGNGVRLSENTSIQAEVADRLAEFYNQAGFKLIYYDGSEQVPGPYWYTIPLAQKIVWDKLGPVPLLAEGSCKSHFSWHMLSRGNAFDIFAPEQMKAGVRAYPAAEIPRIAKDFTTINFGWIGYRAPSEETIGTQPDMLEYVTSVAAAWDCPISMERGRERGHVGDLLSSLEGHPRTPDNLEVIRRWEDVRDQGWLTGQQKRELRNLKQEHTLLIDESGKFELVPWEQIEDVAGAKAPGRAFVFERKEDVWVAYWHTSGEGFLELPVPPKQVILMREIGKPVAVKRGSKKARLPLGEMRDI